MAFVKNNSDVLKHKHIEIISKKLAGSNWTIYAINFRDSNHVGLYFQDCTISSLIFHNNVNSNKPCRMQYREVCLRMHGLMGHI